MIFFLLYSPVHTHSDIIFFALLQLLKRYRCFLSTDFLAFYVFLKLLVCTDLNLIAARLF